MNAGPCLEIIHYETQLDLNNNCGSLVIKDHPEIHHQVHLLMGLIGIEPATVDGGPIRSVSGFTVVSHALSEGLIFYQLLIGLG